MRRDESPMGECGKFWICVLIFGQGFAFGIFLSLLPHLIAIDIILCLFGGGRFELQDTVTYKTWKCMK